ncbi:hypothetical protein [Butyricimonas paravirosa]|jgi:hypothetical protein|uniref:hypothetical protein n=1 Tax=Butyricimonas paravirosa TaxID=1472417 RepID=UPI002A81697A|nr:hypothetical protein [Butyricimonas paravirosa]
MKGIELLSFLTEKQKELLKTSDMQYKRYARIFISIVGFDNNTVTVKVAQKENDAQRYLSAKELRDRVKGVFDGILPEGMKLHVGAVPYTQDNMPDVTVEWVKEQQAKFGLTDSDLAKSVNIDNANLARIFNQRGLTKIHKALFYYFFRAYGLQGAML